MAFTSIEFLLLFFPLMFGLYYLLPKWIRNYFILAASLFFYAWGDTRSIGVLIASILLNYILVLRMLEFDTGSMLRKLVLVLDIAFNVGILFYFKYFLFFLSVFKPLLPAQEEAAQTVNALLPVGISFFTFKAISYAIDIYKENTTVQKNIGYFGMYMAFFPQLLAGPIERYTLMGERMVNREVNPSTFSRGILRFVVGFNKKILIADILSKVADIAFGSTTNSVCMAWLGALCYTLQIYYDFSGYSDMAIGLACMLGFETLENFDYPYISLTITEFWRRWHISLGSWFRDYVYFPLGGSRVKTKGRMIFNLFVVWLLTGIWHGANWTFIIWGLMYGVIISVEKLFQIPQNLKKGKKWIRTLYRLFTLLAIIVGWVIFRADSMKTAMEYLRTMFGFSERPFSDGLFVFYVLDIKYYILFGVLFSVPVLKWLKEKTLVMGEPVHNVAGWVFYVIQIVLFVASISCLVIGTHNPFVYINF